MLTHKRLALVRNKLLTAMRKLATASTHVPEVKREGINDIRDAIAFDMALWSDLKRIAVAGLESVIAEAIQHGVIYDKKSATKEPGNYTLFEGEHSYVTAQVKNGATRLDKAALRTALIKAKVPVHVIDTAFAEAEKRDANSHTFTSWIRVADEPVNPQQPTPTEIGK